MVVGLPGQTHVFSNRDWIVIATSHLALHSVTSRPPRSVTNPQLGWFFWTNFWLKKHFFLDRFVIPICTSINDHMSCAFFWCVGPINWWNMPTLWPCSRAFQGNLSTGCVGIARGIRRSYANCFPKMQQKGSFIKGTCSYQNVLNEIFAMLTL